jgi:hypothetical protein
MITSDTSLNILLAGIASLVVLRFCRGKFWYVFLFLGIILLGIRFSMNSFTVLTGDEKHVKYYTFNRSIDYSFSNGKTMAIKIGNNTLINNTNYTLTVEKVEYGVSSYSTNSNPDVTTIRSYSTIDLSNSVNYFYTQPPNSIRVKGGGGRTRYWLHK